MDENKLERCLDIKRKLGIMRPILDTTNEIVRQTIGKANENVEWVEMRFVPKHVPISFWNVYRTNLQAEILSLEMEFKSL